MKVAMIISGVIGVICVVAGMLAGVCSVASEGNALEFVMLAFFAVGVISGIVCVNLEKIVYHNN